MAHLGLAGAGYAERTVVAASSLHRVPGQVDDAAAVAMIGTGRTALAILDCAQITRDDVVLVSSAAGGLGVLLVQAALDAGAHVIGVAGGPEKVERVRHLGATLALDYDAESWPETARKALAELTSEDRPVTGVTVVLDGVGGTRGRSALELLRPGGRLVIYGWSAGEPTPLSAYDLVGRGITATAAIGPRLTGRPGALREYEERALAELAAGRLVPAITRFPLAEAAQAHAALEGRRTIGKVVLIP